MIIDQANNLDKVSKNGENNTPSKGISNYIKDNNNSKGVFSGKIERYAKPGKRPSVHNINGVNMSDTAYKNMLLGENNNTVVEDIEKQSEVSEENHKNQMVVLANTTSTKDFKEIQKDGFSMEDMNSKAIVTETDKIKAVLAKAGVDISIYGDDLSEEQIKEITGSEALSSQIKRILKEFDLPINESNIKSIENGYNQFEEIKEVSDDTIAYMLKNELAPTIKNIYKAQYSCKDMSIPVGESSTNNEFDQQIIDKIESSGVVADKNIIDGCKWMIQNDIPLTEKNIRYLSDLNYLAYRIEKKELEGISESEKANIIESMAEAIAEGNEAVDGQIIPGYSIIDRAINALEIITKVTDEELVYCIKEGIDISISNLDLAEKIKENTAERFNQVISDYNQSIGREREDDTNQDSAVDYENIDIEVVKAKRQLEEIRLRMTVEANYTMIKNGIKIDTEPLEKLVEDLKEQENSYYERMLDHSGIEVSEKNVSMFSETTILIERLKYQPAYAISSDAANKTITELNEIADKIKDSFDKANQRYETMMTTPRADLGDNIHKAFNNIDNILEGLEIEPTESTERAVRILAYNEIEITEENIMMIKSVDEEVQRTFSNMTPAVTLEMIRKGINPLECSISQLNEIAMEIKNQINDKEEKFSKYLWKLEKSDGISKEERETYIGIYRLISQVEKTDGAVIGSLLNQGKEISMKNLLSEVRTKKKGKMDYTVDDDFNGVEVKEGNIKIDKQIEASYQTNCLRDVIENITPDKMANITEEIWEKMTPEQLKEALEYQDIENDQILEDEYANEQLAQLEEVIKASDDVYTFLDRYDIQNSMANIIAASRMMKNPGKLFKNLFQEDKESEAVEMVRDMKQQIIERFSEAIKNPEEMADAQETLAEVATKVMESMIIEDKTVSTMDIRQYKMLGNQLRICSQMAKEECYTIPIETSEGTVGVSLKIIKGKDDKGIVDIFFNTDSLGNVSASFNVKGDRISSIIAIDNEQGKIKIQEKVKDFSTEVESSLKNMAVDISITDAKDISSEQFHKSIIQKEKRETKSEDNPVQTRVLYRIAESFIKIVREV